MSLIQTLMQSMGGDTMRRISQELGTDEQTAQNATGVAVGALVGGLAKNTRSEGGASGLLGALDRDHDGSVLDDVGSLLGGGDLGNGAGILGHVLGGKQNGIASAVAQATGLDKGQAGKLLQMVAPLVMGALGRQKRQQGMDAGMLSRFLDQEKGELSRQVPAGMGMLDGILDADGDGDVEMSDIVKRGSSLLGGLFKK